MTPRRSTAAASGFRGWLAPVVSLVIVAALPAPAAAQAPADPAVGSWASYRWTSTLTQTVPVLVQQVGAGGQASWSVAQETMAPPPIIVTYAIVRGDRRRYTLQIATQERQDGRPLSITQVTVDRASRKALRSVIRYPKGVIATPESGLRPLRETDVAQGRQEEVTVPAGPFMAVHGAAQGADVWVSNRVPALGLVKGVWPEGTLELVASGATGAPDLLKTPAQ